MKKVGTFIWIGLIFLVVAGVIALIIFGGNKSLTSSYFMVDANAKMEFLTNKNGKVESYMPKDYNARSLIVGETFKDLTVKEACKKYVELASQAGFINVDAKENVILVGGAGGFTQKINKQVYESVNGYLKENGIIGLVVENDKVLDFTKEAKKLGISANKLMLVKSASNGVETAEKELSKLTEKKLIEKIKENQTEFLNSFKETSKLLNEKTKLIDFNRVKFNNHIKNFETSDKRAFSEEFVKFNKENIGKFEKEYAKNKAAWQAKNENNNMN